MKGAGDWTGRLRLAAGEVIYTGPGGTAESHRHLAVQIVRSVDEPFQVWIEGGLLSVQSVLIPSGVEHSFDATGATVVLALVEPTGQAGSELEALAKEQGPIGPMADLPPLGREEPTSLKDLLGQLPSPPSAVPEMGAHVRSAVAYIDAHIEDKLRLPTVAAAIGISPSRLTHLFTDQVGIPLGRYVLWARLRRVVEELGTGTTLSRAAVDAGFSDSSHLSRVFKQNFGSSPSLLTRMQLESDWLPNRRG